MSPLERHQLCVPRLPFLLILVSFPPLTSAFGTNKLSEIRSGSGLWKCSRYRTFPFHRGAAGIRGRRTLRWNRFLVGDLLTGNVACLSDHSKSSSFGAGLHMAFLFLRNPSESQRYHGAHVGCGEHSGSLRCVRFCPNWKDRFFSALDKWLTGRHPAVIPSRWGSHPGIMPPFQCDLDLVNCMVSFYFLVVSKHT